MNLDFSDKVVLVTGASAGIGEAIAILFAKYGAKLSLVGRNEENLKSVSARCLAAGAAGTLVEVADLGTDAGCEAAATHTLDHFGRLDILINNAAVSARTGLERADMATFDSVFNVNVRGVYNLTRLLVPALIATKGNIINISSIKGSMVLVGTLPYCMSKAALDHFTELISLELAPKGVRVNSVNPGITVSTMVMRQTGFSPSEYNAWLEKEVRSIPLGEVCEGEDVACAVLFLASSAARLITGVKLPVDGGLRFTPYGQNKGLPQALPRES